MPPEPTLAPPGVPGPVSILLVEDEDAVREYARNVLELGGFVVVPVNGADAAERAFAADPDRFRLVLTDVQMPGRTGPELARDLRAVRPGLAVLFMSGCVGGPLPLPPGADLLTKPFPPDALLAAV